jgi:hypothetical protein
MTAVGQALAEDVAVLLERGLTIGHAHRDYCGMGLRCAGGNYIYDEVHDGEIIAEADLFGSRRPISPRRQVFDDRERFVHWLARQSDATLHPWPDANQPLTVARLKDVVDRCLRFPRRWDGVTRG